jgi:hypothetical protein
MMILMALLLAGCNLPRPTAVSPGNVPVVPTSTTEGVVPPENPPPAGAATDTPTATFTPSPTASPTATNTPGGAVSFVSVTKSTDKIYWGACTPSEVTFTVTVSDPITVFSVVLFFHIKDKTTGAHPDYTPVAMSPLGNGVFSYVVKAVDVPSHALYVDAWLQYQFVATDRAGKNVGRTEVYPQEVTITGTCP